MVHGVLGVTALVANQSPFDTQEIKPVTDPEGQDYFTIKPCTLTEEVAESRACLISMRA